MKTKLRRFVGSSFSTGLVFYYLTDPFSNDLLHRINVCAIDGLRPKVQHPHRAGISWTASYQNATIKQQNIHMRVWNELVSFTFAPCLGSTFYMNGRARNTCASSFVSSTNDHIQFPSGHVFEVREEVCRPTTAVEIVTSRVTKPVI